MTTVHDAGHTKSLQFVELKYNKLLQFAEMSALNHYRVTDCGAEHTKLLKSVEHTKPLHIVELSTQNC